MRNLFCAAVLGLLAFVQSTPLNTVTQDEVYREAVTDGYLVDLRFLASLTTRSPRRNATVWAALQRASDPKHSDVTEGSGEPSDKTTTSSSPQDGDKDHATTLWTGSHGLATPSDSDGAGSEGSGSGSETTLTGSETTLTSGWPKFTTESNTPSTSTSTAVTETSPLPPEEGSGSGFIEKSTNLSKVFAEPETKETQDSGTPPNAHTTPGWVIIVAFVAGVAAMLMVCVVIVTRDKRTGTNPASQLPTKADQQRELEKEAFLHKDRPMDNGKPGDYIVIPLDELPGKYSSH